MSRALASRVVRDGARVAAIFAATLAAYAPAIRGGLIWDDAAYVTRPQMRSLHGLWRIWFDLGSTEQYYPILHSAFWMEHRLWGDATAGYHLANILEHAAAACLFALVLRRLAVPGAFWAGMLFALHPVEVESVAWISEQKNTLSTVFYLLAALAFLAWSDRREAPNRGAGGGIALYGAASGLFSAWVERTYVGATGSHFALTGIERCLLAARALGFYLGKLLWPANLVFIYPRWSMHPAPAWCWVPLAGVLALTAALWLARRRTRAPLAAWLFYAGSLFPTLGFLNVYAFVFSYVADHWQYLASLGLLALAASAATRLGPTGRAAAPALCAVLGVLTFRQCRQYGDIETFYRATLARNPGAWMVNNNLGSLLLGKGRAAEAVAYFRKAEESEPDYPEIHYNLGDALVAVGRVGDAVAEYEAALRLRPDYAMANANLATALLATGRAAEAVPRFEAALRVFPDLAKARYGLAYALEREGRLPEAIAQYEAALRLDPGDPDVRYHLANALGNLGRFGEAAEQYQAALRLRPDFAEARANLGFALAHLGRYAEAEAQLGDALRQRPYDAVARAYLGFALARAGRLDDAVTQFRIAVALSPRTADFRYQLASALRALGRTEEAEEEYSEAERLESASP